MRNEVSSELEDKIKRDINLDIVAKELIKGKDVTIKYNGKEVRMESSIIKVLNPRKI